MSLIHLFRRCNQRCVFCSYPAGAVGETAAAVSTRGSIPGKGGLQQEKEGLKDWLKEISAMKPGLVQISGGEPLLADLSDLLKVIAFCGRVGRQVELQTNGGLLAGVEPARLALLVKALNRAKACAGVVSKSYAPQTTKGYFIDSRISNGYADYYGHGSSDAWMQDRNSFCES